MNTHTRTETTVDMAQDAIKDAMLRNLELIIRDFAGNVRSLVRSRLDHPSYGITKLQITKALAQMDGVIGTYRVLAGQTHHPFLALGAVFLDDATDTAVLAARSAADRAGIR